MTIWQAVILGLIEGLTEYVPVSSTGHLILAEAFLGLSDKAGKANSDAYAIIIQGGAILAVLLMYWKSVQRMIRGLAGRDADGRRLFVNLVIAFLPAAILGPILDDVISHYLFRPWPVLAALALGGVWMIVIDFSHHGDPHGDHRVRDGSESVSDEQSWIRKGKSIHDLTPIHALGIGLFQCVAMWPGTSRSMMTIAGGTMLGMRPKDAAEFSFLLGLPTLGGACVFKLVKNIVTAQQNGTPNIFQAFAVESLIVGFVVATISAALAVRWLVGFLNRHGLKAFGVYRLILAAVMAVMIITGLLDLAPGPGADGRPVLPTAPGTVISDDPISDSARKEMRESVAARSIRDNSQDQ